jgi:O-acetyl-ADP-ribose deacetylase (regulator of RNase III)
VYIDNEDGSYIDAKSIKETVKSTLSLAEKHNLRLTEKDYRKLPIERVCDSIAFSAIGTNQYKVPLDVSIRNIVKTVKENIQEQKSLKKVSLVLYSENKYLHAMETVKSIMEN